MSCSEASTAGALTQPDTTHAMAGLPLLAADAPLPALGFPNGLAAAAASNLPTAVGFDDEEFPFAGGSLNGVKCCTKCGATKTPQWREGPFGPKTLCNACGVKRTRKLRAEQEGAKRRKLSAAGASPALPSGKHGYGRHASTRGAEAATMRAGSLVLDSYGSLEPELEAWLPALAAPAGGSRRPPRRAAEAAAVKTAQYARTGEWAGEGGDDMGAEEAAALRAATPSSSSGYSLPSSSCPEEVSWPPAALGAGGADCYAAVNLMTMSAKQAGAREAHQQQHHHASHAALPLHHQHHHSAAHHFFAAAAASGAASPSSASLGAPPALPPLAAAAVRQQQAAAAAAAGQAAGQPCGAQLGASAFDPEQFNHDSLAALAAKYESPAGPMPLAAHHHHKVVPVDLAELSACLPPAKVAELVRLNAELEAAVHEAHASNAAVAAVAQVLACKQAAALKSREVAGAATKRLRRFMAELDTQFGIQSKFGARRTPPSPTKPAGLASPAGLPSAAPLSPVAPPPAPLLPAAPAMEAPAL